MTDPLRRLDERLVPRLAEFFDKLIPRAPEPSGPLPLILRLRRVDDRWTQRGPLALIREIPQLGALVIAALVLASGATAYVRKDAATGPNGERTEQGTPAENGDDRLAVGPQLGDSVPAYVEESRRRLADLVDEDADETTVAVISFGQYRTPQQVADLVGEANVVRIFYRASKLTLTEAPPSDAGVVDLLADSKKEFARVAAQKEAEAAELIRVSSTIGDTDPAQKAEQQKDAALYTREAQQLRGDCACIYAVLVTARVTSLNEVQGRPGVRAVDPGAPGARTGDYELYTALLPEEKVTVTGGNQE